MPLISGQYLRLGFKNSAAKILDVYLRQRSKSLILVINQNSLRENVQRVYYGKVLRVMFTTGKLNQSR